MMNSTLTPSMEVVHVPGVISGPGIIHDLLNRIGEKLSNNCDLRQIDAYSGYSAKVSITLQLMDVYPVELVAEVNVGKINPQLPTLQIELGSEVAGAEPEPSLERPVDPEGVVEAAPTKQPRYYTPRGAVPVGSRAPR